MCTVCNSSCLEWGRGACSRGVPTPGGAYGCLLWGVPALGSACSRGLSAGGCLLQGCLLPGVSALGSACSRGCLLEGVCSGGCLLLEVCLLWWVPAPREGYLLLGEVPAPRGHLLWGEYLGGASSWGVPTPGGAYVSPKNKQTAHNQVYNRQIGLRPSQDMFVLPSVQSA